MKKLILIFVLLLGANTVRAQYFTDTLIVADENSNITVGEKFDGQWHGKVAMYRKGCLVEEVTYHFGTPDGPYILYWPNSKHNLKMSSGQYVMGVEHGEKIHYTRDGIPWAIETYHYGKAIAVRKY